MDLSFMDETVFLLWKNVNVTFICTQKPHGQLQTVGMSKAHTETERI